MGLEALPHTAATNLPHKAPRLALALVAGTAGLRLESWEGGDEGTVAVAQPAAVRSSTGGGALKLGYLRQQRHILYGYGCQTATTLLTACKENAAFYNRQVFFAILIIKDNVECIPCQARAG